MRFFNLALAAVVAATVAAATQETANNASLLSPLNGDFNFHYTMTVQSCPAHSDTCSPPAVPRAPGILVTDITYNDGCGGSNQKCSCKVTKTDNTNYATTFVMDGTGTDGTATGLDFVCHLAIEWMDGSLCSCDLHVDIPYSGDNHWYSCSNCLAGFEASIPEGGHSFTRSDTVHRPGQKEVSDKFHVEVADDPPEDSDADKKAIDAGEATADFIQNIKKGDVTEAVTSGVTAVGSILDASGFPEIGVPLQILGTLFGGIFGTPDISNRDVVKEVDKKIDQLGEDIKNELQNMQTVLLDGMVGLSTEMSQKFQQLADAVSQADQDIKQYIQQKDLDAKTQEYASIMSGFQALNGVPLSTHPDKLFSEIQQRWISEPTAQVLKMLEFLGGWKVVVDNAVREMDGVMRTYDKYNDYDGSTFANILAKYNRGMFIAEQLTTYQHNVVLATSTALFRVKHLCSMYCHKADFEIVNITVESHFKNLRDKFQVEKWSPLNGVAREPGNLLLNKTGLGADEHGIKKCEILCGHTAGCCSLMWSFTQGGGHCQLYDKCLLQDTTITYKDRDYNTYASSGILLNSQLRWLNWVPLDGRAIDSGEKLQSLTDLSLQGCEQKCQHTSTCCTFEYSGQQRSCNLYSKCTDDIAPMQASAGWKTYSPKPQAWGHLRKHWCPVGGLVPEQYVGKQIIRIQNCSHTSKEYGLLLCERHCQNDASCHSLAWSPSYHGGDCFLYPKPVPLPARYNIAYDYKSYYSSDVPCPSQLTTKELFV